MHWNISASDLSKKALDVAQWNAEKYELDIRFFENNFLTDDLTSRYDVLVSNPPYISVEESHLMSKGVLDYEPHMALFADDPLVFYKTICNRSKSILKEEASVYVELNEFLAEETESLFNQYFEEVSLKKDLQGKYRMLRARRLLS